MIEYKVALDLDKLGQFLANPLCKETDQALRYIYQNLENNRV